MHRNTMIQGDYEEAKLNAEDPRGRSLREYVHDENCRNWPKGSRMLDSDEMVIRFIELGGKPCSPWMMLKVLQEFGDMRINDMLDLAAILLRERHGYWTEDERETRERMERFARIIFEAAVLTSK